jgi:type I restriction enzyme S subunit
MELKSGYKQTEVGVIPSDWTVVSIENLTPYGRKYGIVDGPFGSNLKTIHYRKSGIPIITSGYVTDGKFFAADYLYVDLEKFKQEKRSSVVGGDIVMAKIGERCGASAILPLNHGQGILSGNALKITIDEEKNVTNLIWQILWNYHKRGDFELLKTTGAQPAISMANLKKFKIPLPSTRAEQTAIATALSDTDQYITHLEKLIAKKRNIKHEVVRFCRTVC